MKGLIRAVRKLAATLAATVLGALLLYAVLAVRLLPGLALGTFVLTLTTALPWHHVAAVLLVGGVIGYPAGSHDGKRELRERLRRKAQLARVAALRDDRKSTDGAYL